jgi:hypothetical protein
MTTINLEQMMTADEVRRSGIEALNETQKQVLVNWGLRMFAMGQHTVADIDEIKYDGRLIILDHGSRWEVDSIDATTASFWNMIDKVVVIDDEMYNLEGCEKVIVRRED